MRLFTLVHFVNFLWKSKIFGFNVVQIQINHPTLSFDRIQVYNVHGQLIKSANMNNSTAQLDLSTLSEGVYFLQVFTIDNQQFVIKQIIKMD